MAFETITASILYDLIQCPHRVYLDRHGDPAKREPVNAFVRLLWERGTAYEAEVIKGLGIDAYTDLSSLSGVEKEQATLEAMDRGDGLIYSGRIRAGCLLGVPDLLRKEHDGYTAGDIKSGAGKEGSNDLEDGKLKDHYAVQLALYTDILRKTGRASRQMPFVWDVHGLEVPYNLDTYKSKRKKLTFWDFYHNIGAQAQNILSGKIITLPASASTCKLCHWRRLCKHEVHEARDLTLIPELGRAKRDILSARIKNLDQMANNRIIDFFDGAKTVFPGIGKATLCKFQLRAKLLQDPSARPFLTEPIAWPKHQKELFYDVETDPFRDICYLHGFTERLNGDPESERYVPFFADEPTPESEEEIFRHAWEYIRQSLPCAIYYYSKYEKTTWLRLHKKYPNVVSEQESAALFDSLDAVDLYYDVVKSKTEWPTNDYSIKTIAVYLGFKWRDDNPSGAESIEWYDEWIRTGDPEIKNRILLYNEDDCLATRVLADDIKVLPLQM